MPTILSRCFSPIEYATGDCFVFPQALPGFPAETTFLPIEIPEQLPLLYLQSVLTPELCFIALPARCVIADYELAENAEDLLTVGLAPGAQPGPEVLCLALVCFEKNGNAVANLRAPIVVNLRNRLGVQVIQGDGRYPFRHSMTALQTDPEEVDACS
jgi:flagellar assembly factor FliW